MQRITDTLTSSFSFGHYAKVTNPTEAEFSSVSVLGPTAFGSVLNALRMSRVWVVSKDVHTA